MTHISGFESEAQALCWGLDALEKTMHKPPSTGDAERDCFLENVCRHCEQERLCMACGDDARIVESCMDVSGGDWKDPTACGVCLRRGECEGVPDVGDMEAAR